MTSKEKWDKTLKNAVKSHPNNAQQLTQEQYKTVLEGQRLVREIKVRTVELMNLMEVAKSVQ